MYAPITGDYGDEVLINPLNYYQLKFQKIKIDTEPYLGKNFNVNLIFMS